jgi:septal ring-binding cell division protein DamX
LNTKTIKQTGISILALAVVLALGACSSKPSPWSQQSSPWDNQSGVEEATPSSNEVGFTEKNPYEDVVVMPIAEPIGPAGDAIAEPVMEVAMMEEPIMEAAVTMETEAVAEPVILMGGDISAQPAEYFAVQVVASSNMENLQAFVNLHHFSAEWIAETSVDGKTWFVLLQGVYATMDEASMALQQVSVNLDTSPWVRSVGSLQAVMIQ